MPSSVCIVQAATRQQYNSEYDDVGESVLASWTAEFGCIMGNSLSMERVRRGSHVDAFWYQLKRWASEHKTCWLFSVAAREQAAILDLWGRFMSKQATLTGCDPYGKGKSKDGNGGLSNGYVVLEGPPTIIQWRDADGETTYTWVDPANYGAELLSQGLAVVKGPDRQASVYQTLPWHDVDGIVGQLVKVREWLGSYLDTLSLLHLGGLEHTAATQASCGYRRQYLDHEIVVHDNEAVLAMERSALYTGRNECLYVGDLYAGEVPPPGTDPVTDDMIHWEKGLLGEPSTAKEFPVAPRAAMSAKGPIYHLDVNSLYPAVAMNATLPVRLEGVAGYVNLGECVAAARSACVVARVKVKTDVPIIPYRDTRGYIFPTGEFWTTLCGPEILLAMEHDALLRCERLAFYTGRPIYGRWVRDLYAARMKARQDKREPTEKCIKSILNASFGKWAQRSRRWEDVPDRICPWPFYQWFEPGKDEDDPEQWRSFAWNVQRMVIQGETGESCPAITAYINSLGRVRLWQLIQTAGKGNVYYYDTDSLICNERGYKNLCDASEVSENTLGKMKVVGRHSLVSLYERKRYIADGQITLAGFGSPSCPTGSAFAVSLSVPPVGHYLTQRIPPGTDRRLIRTRLNRPYHLGHVAADGWVTPIVIDE